jgi:hypothetical protein
MYINVCVTDLGQQSEKINIESFLLWALFFEATGAVAKQLARALNHTTITNFNQVKHAQIRSNLMY